MLRPSVLARAFIGALLVLAALSARSHAGPVQPVPGLPAPQPIDAFWQPMRLPTCEPSFAVAAAIEYGGKLWFGGNFTSFGRSYAGGALRLDGSTLEGIGTQEFPASAAMVEWNGSLYSGSRRGTGIRPVVFRWDAAAWDSLASSDGVVAGMCIYQGQLFVVGSFTVIGGVQAKDGATFDGTSWHALASPPPSSAFSNGIATKLVALGTAVYSYSDRLLKYDGSLCTSMTGGLNSSPTGIASDGVDLFVAGSFTTSAVDSCPSIARWDGTGWRRYGPPPPRTAAGFYASASRLEFWNGGLYTVFNDGGTRMWTNTGAAWVAVSPNLGASPSFIIGAGSRLVVLARFRPPSGGAPGAMSDIKVYDGVQWTDIVDSPGPDMTGTNFYTVAGRVLGDKLFVTGANQDSYNGTFAVRTNQIATWDGAQWSPVGTTLFNQPVSLGQFGNDLVIGGSFFGPGGGRNIASWNGTAWGSYGPDLGFYVLAAQDYLGEKWAGNDFSALRYTGSTWSPIGGAAYLAGQCRTFQTWDNAMIAGGDFTATATGTPLGRVARWDGTAWSALGSGVDETVYALTTDGTDLVVGGEFTHAGGLPIEGVARWDGTQWRAMGTRARAITGFTRLDGVLYAIGVFIQPDDQLGVTAARWNGTDWTTLGSGLPLTSTLPFFHDSFPPTLLDWICGYQGDLYIGGSFGYAFGQATSCIMRLPAANTLAVNDGARLPAIALSVFPNPARSAMRLAFTIPIAGHARLTIHDVQGREVARLVDGEQSPGTHEAMWSSSAPPGLYFARFTTPLGTRSARLVRVE